MNEWLEKHQLSVAIGLIIFIIAGAVVLLFEQQRDKLLLAQKTPAVNEAGWQTERQDMEKMIAELREQIKTLESGNVGQTTGQVAGVQTESTTTANVAGLININSADASALDQLPGIGPAKAQAIISYRQAHGGFKSIDEIKDVKGIGEATFEKMKGLITVGE